MKDDEEFLENADPELQTKINAVMKSYFWFFEEYVKSIDPTIWQRAKDYAVSNLAQEGIIIEDIDISDGESNDE